MRTMINATLCTAALSAILTMYPQHSEAAPAWKCGKKHCFWTEGYTGPVPDYAKAWQAPSGPGCYYVLRAKSKWVEYCPPTTPMQ